MAYTRSTIRKGLGGITLRRITDNRLLYLNFNSRATFSKVSTEGEAVQGTNSEGNLVDLDQAGSEDTYELEVASKKNTRNIDELVMDSIFHTETDLLVPWAEVATIAAGEVTLNGGTPETGTMQVSYLDGAKMTADATPEAGQFLDNGDGTVSFHTDDNGKQVVIYYMIEHASVQTQGGSEHESVGHVEAFFHFISGTSSTEGKKGASILWLPKCAISGETTFEFSNEVQDKPFKLKALIPDTPADWLVPYMFVHGIEIDNTGAG
jgi:hypothetical protein